MKIYIDADGCPVVDIAVKCAINNNLQIKIICDTSHNIQKDGAETIIISKGADSVDFALVNMIEKGDIVITQDYGLGAMCLAKNAIALDQNGRVYNNDNIDALLSARHIAKKIRNAGGRLKGQAKRTHQQDEDFKNKLIKIINENTD